MPVYEYQCPKCGQVTEAIRRMAQADDAIACEHCGHKKTQRVQSVFSASTAGSSSGACDLRGGGGQRGGERGGGGCCGGCCHGHH